MTMLRTLVLAVAGLALAAGNAAADGGPPKWFGPSCNGPFCNQSAYPRYSSFGAYLCGGKSQLPVFQAAPWYLYWPYDAHFMTPAPVTGAFYGPPSPGNFPVNPYFPGPAYGYGYSPIPGGPAPRP